MNTLETFGVVFLILAGARLIGFIVWLWLDYSQLKWDVRLLEKKFSCNE